MNPVRFQGTLTQKSVNLNRFVKQGGSVQAGVAAYEATKAQAEDLFKPYLGRIKALPKSVNLSYWVEPDNVIRSIDITMTPGVTSDDNTWFHDEVERKVEWVVPKKSLRVLGKELKLPTGIGWFKVTEDAKAFVDRAVRRAEELARDLKAK